MEILNDMDADWKVTFSFRAKVFLWRAIVGGLPLAMTLKCKHISSGTHVFCTMIDEDTRYRFISYHNVKCI
jgi:hypothetical protein